MEIAIKTEQLSKLTFIEEQVVIKQNGEREIREFKVDCNKKHLKLN